MPDPRQRPKILLFGGTTEGRQLLRAGLPAYYCAATKYGAALGHEARRDDAEICAGRLSADEMTALLRRGGFAGAIDATHPYAADVKANIDRACAETGTPCFRVVRAASDLGKDAASTVAPPAVVGSAEEAVAWLQEHPGRVLLTTGSKELRKYEALPDYRERLCVRVLPTTEALAATEAMGIPPTNVIAMQGPFTAAENCAHIARLHADILVTKDGGAFGGFAEKRAAAESCRAQLLIVRRPQTDAPDATQTGTVEDALAWANDLLGRAFSLPDRQTAATSPVPLFPLFVDLAGRGVLVAGGGRVACRKARTLLGCGASLRVVSPEISEELAVLAEAHAPRVELIRARFESRMLDEPLRGAPPPAMLVAATDDRAANRAAGEAARARGLHVNVADAPAECTFYFPAFLHAEGFAAGISSSGRSPAACGRLADRLRPLWRAWVADALQDT